MEILPQRRSIRQLNERQPEREEKGIGSGVGFWVNLLTSSPDVGVRVRGPRLLCNQKQEPVLYRTEVV